MVGRDLSSLTVAGDVVIGPGRRDRRWRDVGGLTVNGVFRGQGSPAAVDLGVGLNLSGFSVLGGATNQGGFQSANISVGKNISGINIPHGIFRSWITAGVSINGGRLRVEHGNRRADGATAIHNSEIDAGTSITNLIDAATSSRDSRPEIPPVTQRGSSPAKSGDLLTASRPDEGLISPTDDQGSAIDGALIDAVLAASVSPYGGNGSFLRRRPMEFSLPINMGAYRPPASAISRLRAD